MSREERSEDRTLIVGRKPVKECMEDQPDRVDILYLVKGRLDKVAEALLQQAKKRGILYKLVSREEMERLYPGNHQGLAARISSVPFLDLPAFLDLIPAAPLPVAFALDKVTDTGNVGGLARTLYALGAAGLLVPKHGGAYLGPGAQKASAGALARLPVCRVVNLSQALEKCREAGLSVFGASAGEGAESLYDAELTTPAVMVLGGEEKGLRPGVARRCDRILAIPFRRAFDSLNVAQAGAILAGEFSRRAKGEQAVSGGSWGS